MKQDTLNKLKTGNVVVYMHLLNAWGEVVETGEIARFKAKGWAETFVERIRAEEEANKGRYVGHIYEIVEVG